MKFTNFTAAVTMGPEGAWALISEDQKHRLALGRRLDVNMPVFYEAAETDARRVVFVMLNPSTADAMVDDPTIRKCRQFAVRWQMTELVVVNLYTLRTPYPRHLWGMRDEQRGGNEDNDRVIRDAIVGAARVIAAWGSASESLGAHRMPTAGQRIAHVKQILCATEGAPPPQALGFTAGGYPTHPLARGKGFVPLERLPVPL